MEEIEVAYERAAQRLLLLDYDGTLVPFADYPDLAKPTEDLLKILVRPSEGANTDIVLISGRDRQKLDHWFADYDIGLVAEHGVWLKTRDNQWRLTKPMVNDWREHVRPILQAYVDRLPDSFLEEKEFSLAWHYRRADPELASVRTKELIDNLVEFTSNIDLQVLHGNKVVEVRNAGVNKGIAALFWLQRKPYDFVLAIGDDWTDEDLFRVLPESAYTIKVGMSQSHARFNVHNHLDVINVLNRLLGTSAMSKTNRPE